MSRPRRALPAFSPFVAAVVVVLAASLGAVLATAGLGAGPGEAQGAQEPAGRVSGLVRSGTAGGPAVDALAVQLIVLDEAAVVESLETTTTGGRFAFAVAPDIARSYVVRAVYEGVQYLGAPVLLSAELPTAEVAITVYETTRERPALSIDRTAVTVLSLDRTNAQLTLLREDQVRNPGDRVYLGGTEGGGEGGATLRIPLPDRAVEADGLGGEGAFRVEGGTLVTTAQLRPGVTSVVSRYVVGYDRARDAYTLRVTAPVATGQMEIAVPTRFVDDLEPLAGSAVTGQRDLEGERVEVVAREGAAGPGDSVSVVLEGLAGGNAANPLTGTGGAVVAVVLALAIISGGAALLWRAGSRGGGPA